MPFNVPLATSTMVSAAASTASAGLSWPVLAQVISASCAEVFMLPGTVTAGPIIGTAAGPGLLVSASPIVGIDPASMAAAIKLSMDTSGLLGLDNARVAFNIASGVVPAFMQMVVTGTIIGVGIGSGPGKVTGLQGELLGNRIAQNMALSGLGGTLSYPTALAIGRGIANYLNLAATIPIITAVGPVVVPPVPSTSVAIASLI
jgi:hypothetical protein